MVSDPKHLAPHSIKNLAYAPKHHADNSVSGTPYIQQKTELSIFTLQQADAPYMCLKQFQCWNRPYISCYLAFIFQVKKGDLGRLNGFLKTEFSLGNGTWTCCQKLFQYNNFCSVCQNYFNVGPLLLEMETCLLSWFSYRLGKCSVVCCIFSEKPRS